MPTLLGLDLGTSSFKVSAYDADGSLRGTVSCATPWRSEAAGMTLRPEEFADAVRGIVDECAEAHALGDVAGLGVTGMAETMFVDTAAGDRIPARAWHGRGSAATELPAGFARTGLIDGPRTPLVELRRLTQGGTAVRTWTGLPEEGIRVFGGEHVAERSLVARTGLVDIVSGGWSPEMLAWAGVADADLPAIRPAGTGLGVVNTGRCAGAVLTVAGHDHVTAVVGAGADRPDTVFDSLGTGEALITRIRTMHAGLDVGTVTAFTAAGYNVGFGVGDDDVIAFGGLGTGNRYNLLLDALSAAGYARDALMSDDGCPSADEQSASVARLDPRAIALLDRAFGADWQGLKASGDADAIIAETVADLAAARALWWAAVLWSGRMARDSLDALDRLLPGERGVVAAGGWLGSPGIRRIRARAMGRFAVPDLAQAGTRGAALLAGLAAGVFSSRADFPPLTHIQEAS